MFIWLPFAGVTVLGWIIYEVMLKLSGLEKASPIVGMVVLTVISLSGSLLLLSVYEISGSDFKFTPKSLIFSAFAALGVLLGELSMFYVYERGAPLSIASPIVLIGTIISTFLIGAILFDENVTLTKIIGVLMGIVSIYTLVK